MSAVLLNTIEEAPTFLINLKALLATQECSAVTNPNYAEPIAPAGNASQLAKDVYFNNLKKYDKVIEKSFGIIISCLANMPTIRDNILAHATVIAAGANGNRSWTKCRSASRKNRKRN